MARECNSEYVYELIKRCRFMYLLKNGTRKCKCTKECAMCSIGGKTTIALKPLKKNSEKEIVPAVQGREIASHQVNIWMHPELHEEYIRTQAVNIGSNESARTMSGGPSVARKARRKRNENAQETENNTNEQKPQTTDTPSTSQLISDFEKELNDERY